MNDLHWFPFYYVDFFGDEKVVPMDLTEVGGYITLLTHQWKEGSVPADPDMIAAILRITGDDLAQLWPRLSPCFPSSRNPERLQNPRMKKIIVEQRQKSRVLSEAGRRGGKSKPRKVVTSEARLKPGLSLAKARLKHTEIEIESEQNREETTPSPLAVMQHLEQQPPSLLDVDFLMVKLRLHLNATAFTMGMQAKWLEVLHACRDEGLTTSVVAAAIERLPKNAKPWSLTDLLHPTEAPKQRGDFTPTYQKPAVPTEDKPVRVAMSLVCRKCGKTMARFEDEERMCPKCKTEMEEER